MTPHNPSRLEAVLADLRDRGYCCPDPIEDETPVVATGGDHPTGGPDVALSIDRLRAVTPLTITGRIATAAHAGRAPVLVVDEWGLEDVRAVLGESFLLRDRVDDRRQFYSIPDRIALSDGRYACVRTDTEPQWREDASTTATGRDRTDTDDPRLLLEADGSIQAVLESTDALTCPGPDPAAFPYRYGRGPDKRIHVFDRDREVGRYAGIAAMRANAYRPVAMPLVPEQHVRTGGRLARSATLAVATADGVTYERF
ncbi:hypothetical protein RBH26_06755 [Natronolimnohabitans sp. A-GB9]|uniref:hypothetical protein n=1 Tax=Natronolimnohabitans sp. A-GB9 TaxID=3069757 RepID=UPI0027B22AB6|nr:hypothetical protein [Natronolimnohabitans sp. A-GB9]MDQ2050181.1 hypothetical protein [Natronolimnohabitans sp. A-GB9]